MFHNPARLIALLVVLFGCTAQKPSRTLSSQKANENSVKANEDSISAFEDDISALRNLTPQEVTRRRMRILVQWIDSFRASNGRVPSRIDEIVHPDPTDPNFRPPERWWSDGWDRRLSYTVADQSYELRSGGEDRTFGTDDDLVVKGP